ncbi:class I SAM-dependent methyltransferase [Gloeocapsopsis crepidinum LEGE 06123]|uniref:Class I SAM-dependent methyltransferase n=1 Tax=Gloeocapsopsis crepidinum LEGE 06123 TaxID=588587 RepID=A0ABR9UX43_9CHRO|nr:class I SAM-dependent methyltransferase [Gloeocapsopsis crepidinum LEGE 06123]
MTQSVSDSNPALCEEIALRIANSPQHRITFAEYMDLVLYHPQYGYYNTHATKLGKQGDFFTSPHLGADFGELLAEQFLQIWEILEKPVPFTLLEMGAGQGILALDILNYLEGYYPDFLAALSYVIIERSPSLIQEQQQRLQKYHSRIQWQTLEEIPVNSIVGCCFSNELVDALPVHQIVIENGQLREIYVTSQTASTSHATFTEVGGELSTARIIEYFDLNKITLPSPAYPEGYRSEVNLAALDWLKMVAARLQRGYLLTIDYGYSANRYYNPIRQGTLQCYYRHHRHNDPYLYIGQQDITAHVDFTALQVWGELCGLTTVGLTQQGLFLMALGLGNRIATLSTSPQQSVQKLLQRRDSLHQLIDPMGLGGFNVLVQSKGAIADMQLKGLSLPLI